VKKLPLAALLSLAFARQAQATPVTYDFGGIISAVFGSPASISVGDTFTGSFTYDVPGPADSDPNPGVGEYLSAGNPDQISVSIGSGNSLATDAATANERLRVINDGVSGDEFLFQEFGFTSNTVPQGGLSALSVDLIDTTGLVFADTSLTSVLTFSNFDSANFVATVRGYQVFGDITSVSIHGDPPPTDVPEPATMTLLGMSLFGGLAARRKARV
jgi:hypothetical protein